VTRINNSEWFPQTILCPKEYKAKFR